MATAAGGAGCGAEGVGGLSGARLSGHDETAADVTENNAADDEEDDNEAAADDERATPCPPRPAVRCKRAMGLPLLAAAAVVAVVVNPLPAPPPPPPAVAEERGVRWVARCESPGVTGPRGTGVVVGWCWELARTAAAGKCSAGGEGRAPRWMVVVVVVVVAVVAEPPTEAEEAEAEAWPRARDRPAPDCCCCCWWWWGRARLADPRRANPPRAAAGPRPG
jgi:hypothetical protein